MALLSGIFGLLGQLESTYITVHQNRCVSVRNRHASCLRCAEACTSGCIACVDNELTISLERCIGCGTCTTVCPTGALEARKPDDAGLLEELLPATEAAGGLCTIACVDALKELERVSGHAHDSAKVVGVACMGRVEESILIALVDAGARRIDLVKGDCAACRYGKGLEIAQAVCASATTLLRAWDNSTEVRITDELPVSVLLVGKKSYDEGKRAFFSAVGSEIKGLADRVTGHVPQEQEGGDEEAEPVRLKVMSDGTLPHFIPDRRERLLRCLADLGEPRDILIETRLWGHVIIDTERCNACQMCATFCPTGAIAKYADEGGSFGVTYRPRDCVKCRCCADICPESALTISEEVFAVDLLSGIVERYEMSPAKSPWNKPRTILGAMRGLLDSDQVYER